MLAFLFQLVQTKPEVSMDITAKDHCEDVINFLCTILGLFQNFWMVPIMKCYCGSRYFKIIFLKYL